MRRRRSSLYYSIVYALHRLLRASPRKCLCFLRPARAMIFGHCRSDSGRWRMRHKLPWSTRSSAAAAAFCMRLELSLNAMNTCSACRSEHICVPVCGICHGLDGDRCVCTLVSTRVVERCPVTLWDLYILGTESLRNACWGPRGPSG